MGANPFAEQAIGRSATQAVVLGKGGCLVFKVEQDVLSYFLCP